MNERIQELSEQAEKYADDNFRGEPTWSEAFESKFAELIVRECAKSANDWYQNHDKIHSDPMSYVLAHFGVEESKGWVCHKCGTDRTKQECPKGYTAALTGKCPMIGEAQ